MTKPRTAIVARRQALLGTAPPRHRWPTYLVTAPHGRPGADDDHPRLPVDTWHARQVGSLQTACGRAAVTWQFFWTLSFERAGTAACDECVRSLRRTAGRPTGDPYEPGGPAH